MKAPRITSRPRLVASATSPIISTNAPRTRIWAVVSWSILSTDLIRAECSTPLMLSPTRIETRIRPPSKRICVVVLFAWREKKSDSRITAPKSAIDPAAITSWPNREPI